MCGIFGYLNLSSSRRSITPNELKKSLDIISYRGPDYSGYKLFEQTSEDNFKIFLGHNRLSIIDLSEAGNQPFTINEKYHVVFNGEIYNYIEIRDDLIKKGFVFRTGSDTEVLLNLYIESGTKRFGELNGMWSFLIYDEVKNQVIASRDRFGVKPMYILEQDGAIFFASEIKQLLPFSKSRTLNKEVLANYLHHYLLDYNEQTFFSEITKLPAMHSLTIELSTGKRVLDRYWDFTLSDNSGASDDELVKEYRNLFEAAVNIRLRSDVKVGNTLSGGLDSSSIAVMAHNATKGNFFNYSVISSNKDVSEEKFVDYLVEHNGINVKKINFDSINPWESVDKVIWHHDEPILSLSTIAHYKMLEILKKESDIIVVLSGQGGDESLAGYNKYFFFNIKDLIRQGKYGQAMSELAQLVPRVGSEFKWNFAKRYIPFINKVNLKSDTLGQLIKLDKPASMIGATGTLRDRQILDIRKFSVPPLCHYEDRNSMAHSLEIRLPFLDYRLVNFTLNLPNHLKIKNAVNKQVLRKAMFDLPSEIRNRFDKKGFTIDEKRHQNAAFASKFKETFKDSALADLQIIAVDRVKDEFKKMQENKGNLWERDLHRILFAEIWAKKFL